MGSCCDVEGQAGSQVGEQGRLVGGSLVAGGDHRSQGRLGRRRRLAGKLVAFGGPCVRLDGSVAFWRVGRDRHHVWAVGNDPSGWWRSAAAVEGLEQRLAVLRAGSAGEEELQLVDAKLHRYAGRVGPCGSMQADLLGEPCSKNGARQFQSEMGPGHLRRA